MKKLALVFFSAILLVIIIAFNYLLWDRENKEKSIESLESSRSNDSIIIKTLDRQLNDLDEENKRLEESLAALEKEKTQLQSERAKLREDIQEIQDMLDHQKDLIYRLKQVADIKVFQVPVLQWAEAVDSGDYQVAYKLLELQMANQNEVLPLEQFSEKYRASVKSMKVSSVELYADSEYADTKDTIVLKVSLEVKKPDNPDNNGSLFVEGLNQVYITVDYIKERGGWTIVHITDKPLYKDRENRIGNLDILID